MDHKNLENTTSTALMLPKDKENSEEKVVILTPDGRVGKILIREDTILNNLQGCAGCGRAQFACAGMKKQWSVLCWGRPSDTKYYCLLVLLSITFVLSLLGTVFFCFTNTINDAILSNMVIRNNSLAFSLWRRPSVTPLMKVHIFNYTNWEQVRAGFDDKLHVEDIGPYTYSQHIERVNINFEGDKLTFQERNSFKFLPEKSTGTTMDRIVVPNLPLISAVSKAIDMNLNPFLHLTLSASLKGVNNPDPFVNLPLHSFLWGYDDTIIDIAKIHLSLNGQLNFNQFGLLVTKNGTVADRLTINTGENDMSRMNLIEELNGQSHLTYWGTPDCNRIGDASDGSMFPPTMLDKKTPLQVLYPNLCRRLPFNYEKDVEFNDGIKLLRYSLPDNVFDDAEHNRDNECYCEIDTATCPPRGLINITKCLMGAPVLASFPHFHRGAAVLREDVDGLQEDFSGENYIDFHPSLGIALSGKSSLQMNVQVRKLPYYRSMDFLKQGIVLPVAWIEMSIEELPEGLKLLVYHGTYSTAAAQLGLMVFSILALIVSSISLYLLLRRRRKPCATIKAMHVEACVSETKIQA